MTGQRWAEVLAWTLSIAAHLALGFYVHWTTSAPDLGFEFELPSEVEFGLTESVAVSAGATPPPAAADPQESGEPGEEGPGESVDAGVPTDAGPADAGVPDGGPPRPDAGPEQVASADEGEGTGDEGEGTGDEEGEGRGVAFLPAGSQIALRLDVTRIRESPLAPDMRQFLAAMPDWQALLEGSGVEPLDDLDRVLVATPNLQRSRLIVAGRTTGDAEAIRAAAGRLAESSGETLEWRTEHGVDVARWYNHDPTERVVAIIGPRHFIISRPQDLPRVLAVARNRGEAEETHFADALLSMEEGEGLSLEIEGARNFARASQRRRSPIEMIPTELRLALTQLPQDRIAARTRWTYEDDDEADAAGTYWNRMREQYGRNMLVRAMVGDLLSNATLEPDGEALDGSVDLEVSQMRRLMALARGFFEMRAAQRERARQQAESQSDPGPSPSRPPDNPFDE